MCRILHQRVFADRKIGIILDAVAEPDRKDARQMALAVTDGRAAVLATAHSVEQRKGVSG